MARGGRSNRPSLSRLRVATTAMSKIVRMDEGDGVMANIVRRNPSVTKLSDVESRKLLEQNTATAIELVAIDAVNETRETLSSIRNSKYS